MYMMDFVSHCELTRTAIRTKMMGWGHVRHDKVLILTTPLGRCITPERRYSLFISHMTSSYKASAAPSSVVNMHLHRIAPSIIREMPSSGIDQSTTIYPLAYSIIYKTFW